MVPRTSPCSAPRSVENTRPEGKVVTESDWCCHSVQAEAWGKWVRRAARMSGHSALPNILTRSRSAATSGSRVPLSTRGSIVPRQ